MRVEPVTDFTVWLRHGEARAIGSRVLQLNAERWNQRFRWPRVLHGGRFTASTTRGGSQGLSEGEDLSLSFFSAFEGWPLNSWPLNKDSMKKITEGLKKSLVRQNRPNQNKMYYFRHAGPMVNSSENREFRDRARARMTRLTDSRKEPGNACIRPQRTFGSARPDI